jgi:hypothetical protein
MPALLFCLLVPSSAAPSVAAKLEHPLGPAPRGSRSQRLPRCPTNHRGYLPSRVARSPIGRERTLRRYTPVSPFLSPWLAPPLRPTLGSVGESPDYSGVVIARRHCTTIQHATTLSALAASVFRDANGSLRGNQALGANRAAVQRQQRRQR